MATVSKTYSTADWKVWTYKPFDDRFILDFSKLDDAATPLSASEGSVAVIDALIGGITITEGSAVTQGIFTELQPAQATVEMIMKDFVVADSKLFLVGSPIWITYHNAETVDDVVYGKNTPIFKGKISSFNVDVTPGEDFASITVTAESTVADDVNQLVTITKDTTSYKYVLLATAAGNSAGDISTYLNGPSFYHYASTNTETKTFGEWVTDLNLCDMNIIFDSTQFLYNSYRSPSSANFGYVQRTATESSTNSNSSTKTFYEDVITDVKLDWSGADSPTGVTLTNYFNPATIYQYGSSAENANGGAYQYANTVDVKDLTEMTTIGQKMLAMFKEFSPVTINVKVATNYQTVYFPGTPFLNSYSGLLDEANIYPENLVPIGTNVWVVLPSLDVSSHILVTGRTIVVTPDDWTCSYNLWKGFTS